MDVVLRKQMLLRDPRRVLGGSPSFDVDAPPVDLSRALGFPIVARGAIHCARASHSLVVSARIADSAVADGAGFWGTADGGSFEPHAARSATDVQSSRTVIAVLQSHRASAASIFAPSELKATTRKTPDLHTGAGPNC
jgi:hypothetical protein